MALRLIAMLALWLALAGAVAAQTDALDQLLAEHPLPQEPPALPHWVAVSTTTTAPPVLGEAFTVDARVRALLAPLPRARYRWELPKGARVVQGQAEGPLPLELDRPANLRWSFVFEEPLTIVEGQLALKVESPLPREAMLAAIRSRPASEAALLQEELRQAGDSPRSAEVRLEVAVNAREGFIGFTPLVWGSYLSGDGFYVGAGSFMDNNFSAQDLVSDAEKQLLGGNLREARALLEKARVDLRPGVEADALLRFEAANCEAICQFLTGDRKGARRAWLKMLMEPGFEEMRRYVHYNLGEAARLDGDAEGAQRAFRAAAAEKPAFRLPVAKLGPASARSLENGPGER